VLLLGAAALGAGGPRAAWAAIVPTEVPTPAKIFAELALNVPPKLEVVTFGEHQLFGSGGRLRVDSALFPSPYLMAAAVEVPENLSGRVAASLEYQVVIVGPDPGARVPVDVSVSGEIKGNVLSAPLGSGTFSLKATWSLASADGTLFVEGGVDEVAGSANYFDSFHDVQSIFMTVNQRHTVRLVADTFVATGTTNGASGGGYSFVDPVFSFGPGVGPEYSFLFSEGVGNLPVPEPHAFLLMAAGLLTMGWFSRLGANRFRHTPKRSLRSEGS
jgi:hypothetical protein